MTVWNLGSINSNLFYAVAHFPAAGETLAAIDHRRGLGGKGANISVAAARAAAHVVHVGAVGGDGRWAVDRLMEYGVDTRHIAAISEPTGHAIILTEPSGENRIITAAGANRAISDVQVRDALTAASIGDWFVCQNETNGQEQGAKLARQLGQKVAYVAAPFDAAQVETLLPYLDLLILNEVEAIEEETGGDEDLKDKDAS